MAAEPESAPEPIAVVEPVPAPAPVSAVVAEPEPVIQLDVEPEAETVTVIELDAEPEPVVASVAAADDDTEELVEIEPERQTEQGLDQVLRALINRAQFTQREVAEVAAELVDRAQLDATEVAEVLADLVEAAEGDEGATSTAPVEELTLFSDEVPRRPGQMTDFAELGERERRRVIIRVLCLLVARNEEQRGLPKEPASEAETRQWPLSRAVWPLPAPEEEDEADLPARRHGLARSRR